MYDSIIDILDKDELKKRLDDRLKREAAEKEEKRKILEAQKEAAEIKRKKLIKRAVWIYSFMMSQNG